MTTKSYEQYHWYKEHGICVDCKKENAAKGKSRCLYCASIRAEKKYAKHISMTDEEREEHLRKRRERYKKQREQRKADGLCTQCGKPAYKGKSLCYEHQIYYKKYHKKWNNEHRVKGYAEIGLCRICGKEVVKGKKFCEEHLQQYREHMAKYSHTVNKED